MVSRVVVVNLEEGVHARPAADLVRVANSYNSEIKIKVGGTVVDAKSVLSILKLTIRNGTEVQLQAEGPDEDAAVEALAQMFTTPR